MQVSHLTFNFVFGQVHRGAVGEDVGDGADAPVHQRGGDWMHRHGCDLWLPPASWSYRDVYEELPNFPERPPAERESEPMDAGTGVCGCGGREGGEGGGMPQLFR